MNGTEEHKASSNKTSCRVNPVEVAWPVPYIGIPKVLPGLVESLKEVTLRREGRMSMAKRGKTKKESVHQVDDSHITLSEQEWETMNAAVEAPPKVLPALKRLLSKRRACPQ